MSKPALELRSWGSAWEEGCSCPSGLIAHPLAKYVPTEHLQVPGIEPVMGVKANKAVKPLPSWCLQTALKDAQCPFPFIEPPLCAGSLHTLFHLLSTALQGCNSLAVSVRPVRAQLRSCTARSCILGAVSSWARHLSSSLKAMGTNKSSCLKDVL